MKRPLKYFILIILFFTSIVDINARKDRPVLKGPYLGQKPPGMTPELFAPGIISTGYTECYPFFTPDGRELYFMLWGAPYNVILYMREEKNGWTKPRIAPFFKRYDEKFCLSPDGETIVLGSYRHRLSEGDERYKKPARMLIIRKKGNDWGEAQQLKDSINGPVSISETGNLYFSNPFDKGMGGDDIFVSKYSNGEYGDPLNLGTAVNTIYHECDPCIAHDESYLIFCRRGEGYGRHDLYISFRKKDDSWTQATNMGEKFNTPYSELCPNLSADGKYPFFTSNRRLFKPYSEVPLTYEQKLQILGSPGNGSADIYWVDARIIEELKESIIHNPKSACD